MWGRMRLEIRICRLRSQLEGELASPAKWWIRIRAKAVKAKRTIPTPIFLSPSKRKSIPSSNSWTWPNLNRLHNCSRYLGQIAIRCVLKRTRKIVESLYNDGLIENSFIIIVKYKLSWDGHSIYSLEYCFSLSID